ncbi:MAG: NAD-dependent DNA ligase LigA [Proteobacteria bacterium]|nr:NAD-dependent DNA ligase LigA [Pseudomonadota bacterium]
MPDRSLPATAPSELELRARSLAELEAAVRQHNHRYWDLAAPTISDYDFDRLVQELARRAPDAPILRELGPSPAGRHGAEVQHRSPMLSLDKCYDDRALEAWVAKFEGEILATPKLDGIAASLRYDARGELVLAATRGSGAVGEDITANVRTIAEVPPRVVRGRALEVRGELYLRKSVFAGFGEHFANPRNLAAGAIKSKDPERCRSYGLSFAPYDLLEDGQPTEHEKLAALAALGFHPVDHLLVARDGLQQAYAHFAALRERLDYEIDGVVFKADRVAEQQRLGLTAHHPRFAIAYKFQGDSRTSVLEAVSWSVARSGVITPIAHLRPVELSGAMVSRASLHHAGFIAKLGLSLDAEVLVTRRGGVIPKVERVLRPGAQRVTVPQHCPSCAGPVLQRGDFLHCAAPSHCREAVLGGLAHYCAVVDLQGFGDKLLRDGFEQGLLRSPADLYRLGRAELLRLDRVGEKLATRLLQQLAARRRLSLEIFLRALGVEELGQHVARLLAEHFAPLARVRQLTVAELLALPSVGEVIASKVVAGLQDAAALIDALLAEVVLDDSPRAAGASIGGAQREALAPAGPLVGKSFVFTGKLETFERKAAQRELGARGATTPAGVSQALDYLVVGAGDPAAAASSKLLKAQRLRAAGAKLQIVSEEEFRALLERA